MLMVKLMTKELSVRQSSQNKADPMEMKGRGAENVEGFVDTGALQDRAQFYLP